MSNIPEDMQILYADARALGKWIRSKSLDRCFSPEELEREQKRGFYERHISDWELVDPEKYLSQLREQRDRLETEINKVETWLEQTHG